MNTQIVKTNSIIHSERSEESLKKSSFMIFRMVLFLFTFSFLLISFHKVSAATLYSEAANQDTYVGQTFVVDWYLDSETQSINTINLNLNFSADTLEVSDINSGNSLINLWIANPKADNQKGSISLVGGITNGIVSSKIPIFRATFRAKKSGQAFISLDPTSQILLNDGRGTGETLKFKNEVFNIYPENFIPADISSPTHPDQNAWYRNHDVVIKFAPKDGTQYSYSFSTNAVILPDSQPMQVPAEITYPARPDGIYYFKLNSKQGPGNWQEAGVYRVQIDSTPPEPFAPEIGTEGDKKFVSFSTLDKTSGILHYKVKFGWFGKEQISQNPYVLIPKFFVGNQIQITAVDAAGNSRTEKITHDTYPQWINYLAMLVILAALALGTWKIKTTKSN